MSALIKKLEAKGYNYDQFEDQLVEQVFPALKESIVTYYTGIANQILEEQISPQIVEEELIKKWLVLDWNIAQVFNKPTT